MPAVLFMTNSHSERPTVTLTIVVSQQGQVTGPTNQHTGGDLAEALSRNRLARPTCVRTANASQKLACASEYPRSMELSEWTYIFVRIWLTSYPGYSWPVPIRPPRNRGLFTTGQYPMAASQINNRQTGPHFFVLLSNQRGRPSFIHAYLRSGF